MNRMRIALVLLPAGVIAVGLVCANTRPLATINEPPALSARQMVFECLELTVAAPTIVPEISDEQIHALMEWVWMF